MEQEIYESDTQRRKEQQKEALFRENAEESDRKLTEMFLAE